MAFGDKSYGVITGRVHCFHDCIHIYNIYIYIYIYTYVYIYIYIYMICSKRQNVVQVLHFLLIYECVYINIKINTGKTKAS